MMEADRAEALASVLDVVPPVRHAFGYGSGVFAQPSPSDAPVDDDDARRASGRAATPSGAVADFSRRRVPAPMARREHGAQPHPLRPPRPTPRPHLRRVPRRLRRRRRPLQHPHPLEPPHQPPRLHRVQVRRRERGRRARRPPPLAPSLPRRSHAETRGVPRPTRPRRRRRRRRQSPRRARRRTPRPPRTPRSKTSTARCAVCPYRGDVRVALGAEDARKIERIARGSAGALERLYRPATDALADSPVGLRPAEAPGREGAWWGQDKGEGARATLLAALPRRALSASGRARRGAGGGGGGRWREKEGTWVPR